MDRQSRPDPLREALGDCRVARALHLALRDARLRASFEELRSGGMMVDEAVEQLLGPYHDERGEPYYLSNERVRSIVYRK